MSRRVEHVLISAGWFFLMWLVWGYMAFMIAAMPPGAR